MYLKALTLVFVCLSSSIASSAQDQKVTEDTRRIIYLEAGGYGGYGSINYELPITVVERVNISARLGLGSYHIKDFSNSINPDILIPLGINAYYGRKHHIDMGIGQTISSIIYADKTSYEPNRKTTFSTNMSLGYRYQKEDGHLMFRVAYTPILENNSDFRHWGSLAVGYTFRQK